MKPGMQLVVVYHRHCQESIQWPREKQLLWGTSTAGCHSNPGMQAYVCTHYTLPSALLSSAESVSWWRCLLGDVLLFEAGESHVSNLTSATHPPVRLTRIGALGLDLTSRRLPPSSLTLWPNMECPLPHLSYSPTTHFLILFFHPDTHQLTFSLARP